MFRTVPVEDGIEILKRIDKRDTRKNRKSPNDYLSKITVVFNDKLRIFIKEVQNEFKNKLEGTKELGDVRNWINILNIQKEIREYIILHQNRVDYTFAKELVDGYSHSMSNLFALHMMVIGDVDKMTNALDIMEQIDDQHTEAIFYEETEQTDSVCVCSHKCMLKSMFIITNSKTKYNAVIGNECINKYYLVDTAVIKEAKKKSPEGIKKQKIKDDKKKIKDEKTEKKLLKIRNEIEGKKKAKEEQKQHKIDIKQQAIFSRLEQITTTYDNAVNDYEERYKTLAKTRNSEIERERTLEEMNFDAFFQKYVRKYRY